MDKTFENFRILEIFRLLYPNKIFFFMFYDLLITQRIIFMTYIKVIMDKSSFKNLIFKIFETQHLIDAFSLWLFWIFKFWSISNLDEGMKFLKIYFVQISKTIFMAHDVFENWPKWRFCASWVRIWHSSSSSGRRKNILRSIKLRSRLDLSTNMVFILQRKPKFDRPLFKKCPNRKNQVLPP